MAFRLCALRETFEESGLLLTCNADRHVPEADLAEWRPRVHAEPGKFIEMCAEYGVCPDLWATHEWSCWLTPLGRHDPGDRRFDTLFLATFAEKALDTASLENKEITDVQWTDPETVLQDCREKRLWLAPPQVYELTRMRQHATFDGLRRMTVSRARAGLSTWMPVFFTCKDGFISTLPGDELYPERPDFLGLEGEQEPLDLTMEEVNEKYPRGNRAAIYGKNDIRPFVTVDDGEMVLKDHYEFDALN